MGGEKITLDILGIRMDELAAEIQAHFYPHRGLYLQGNIIR